MGKYINRLKVVLAEQRKTNLWLAKELRFWRNWNPLNSTAEIMAKEIQFILYNLPDNSGTVQAIVQNETIFLTQKAMAQLFDVGIPAINKHLNNIYQEWELQQESTISNIEIVQQEGNRQVKREQTFYSLDAIISVGYRVNSQRATLFRIWATRVLNEFIRKGFVLDDDRLKQGNAVFGRDYFRELLERVRSIRAS